MNTDRPGHLYFVKEYKPNKAGRVFGRLPSGRKIPRAHLMVLNELGKLELPPGYICHHEDEKPGNDNSINIQLILNGNHIRLHHCSKREDKRDLKYGISPSDDLLAYNRAWSRKYRQNNPEKVMEYQKKYQKKYRKTNRNTILIKARAKRVLNRDNVLNRDKINKQKRKWVARNRDAINARRRELRAIKKQKG